MNSVIESEVPDVIDGVWWDILEAEIKLQKDALEQLIETSLEVTSVHSVTEG